VTPLFPSASLGAGYVVACLLLAVTPGPDMAVFISRTLRGGRAQGFAALGGAINGLLIHSTAAAVGLSALLAASAEAYSAVKIAGAAYLLWLAFGALRHGAALKLKPNGAARSGVRGAFLNGLLVNLTNPKIVIFFVTFLPQFTDVRDPYVSAKLFALGLCFIAIGAAVAAAIIFVAARFVSAARAHPRRLRIFDYAFAALMSAFAGRLVWSEAR